MNTNIFTKDLPIDKKLPKSCIYWLYDKQRHTDPRVEGYVGVSSRGLPKRLNDHRKAAEKGSKLPVHRAIRKYGENLGYQILIEADPEFCLLVENMLRPVPNMPKTWNVAQGGVPSPTTGTKLSLETRAKISLANSGENSPWFGRKHSVETLLKSQLYVRV